MRGFISVGLLLTLIVAVFLGGGTYYVMNGEMRYTFEEPESTTEEQLPGHDGSKTPNADTLASQGTSEVTPIGIESCISSLYTENRTQYDYWKRRYGDMHPEYAMYDAGSYCLLNDGTQLVSFSFFKKTGGTPGAAGQSIALFDAKGTLIRETNGLVQKTLGDVGTPRIDALKAGKVFFSFSSGDAGATMKQTYELQLSDFSFVKTGTTSALVETLPLAESESAGPVFSVKKVPAGFSMDMSSKEKTMEFSYTTQKLAHDPTKLQICWTLVDAADIVQTETDCWPLKTYGTVTLWIDSDFSLSPSPTNTIYKPGHHTVKLLVELVDPAKYTVDPGMRTVKLEPIASDDTGFFDLYFPSGAE